MKFHITLSFAILALLVISCKPKTEHTIVQGYVKTYGSETTHEGIEIELRQDGGLPLDITKSNADGWYRLEGDFEVNKRQYLYTVNTPPLHDFLSNQPNANFEVSSGGIQRIDLEIPAFCWINIHFKNIDPCNQEDFLTFRGNYGGQERIYGAMADQYFIYQSWGNQVGRFFYTVSKCGNSTSYIDTIGYIAAFDTVDFEVFY